MDSTLTVYRRFYNRIHAFIKLNGTEIYTKEAGEQFLQKTTVSESTLSAYKCQLESEPSTHLNYSKNLGMISMNHALFSKLTKEDYSKIRRQMREDLENYYRGLESD